MLLRLDVLAYFSHRSNILTTVYMTVENIRISLSEGARDGVSEIRVDGVIDTMTAGELEEVIDRLISRSRYRLIVDLAGVDYISSPGWGIFISHIKEIRENDGDIKLSGMVPNVREIFELLELDNVLRSYNSVDEARGDFGIRPPEGGLKKKEGKLTRLMVVDDVVPVVDDAPRINEPDGSTGAPGLTGSVGSVGSVSLSGSSRLKDRLLRLVQKDPFASIADLRSELGSGPGAAAVGWWQVFSVLRRHKLLSRRSRFHFARNR